MIRISCPRDGRQHKSSNIWKQRPIRLSPQLLGSHGKNRLWLQGINRPQKQLALVCPMPLALLMWVVGRLRGGVDVRFARWAAPSLLFTFFSPSALMWIFSRDYRSFFPRVVMCTSPRDLGIGWDTREQPILQVCQVRTVLLLAKGHLIIHVHTHNPLI